MKFFTNAVSRMVLRGASPAHQQLLKSVKAPLPSSWARSFSSNASRASYVSPIHILFTSVTAATFVMASISHADHHEKMNTTRGVTNCGAYNPKTGGDIVMIGATKESSTGILFPNLCNAMTFAGCGVRVKYGFVKVYAVGTYVDPIAMSGVKSSAAEIQRALLDPTFPRTIRIVMNRSLSIEKYTAAIVEALEPRMKDQDLDKLEEFKKMNPKVDLIEGAEMEMTIRGNVMLYKNALGGVAQIDSRVFCEALCDVYYGNQPVSPGHKEEQTHIRNSTL